jgi:eukaryotic-like serine/threonine-protein kinase
MPASRVTASAEYDRLSVAETPGDQTSPGKLRALYGWLKGEPTPTESIPPGDQKPAGLPARIGHYAIERKLGQGGMGVVYAAHDGRLKRTVALKMISSAGDDKARTRFWREARVAASVNHPNVCQIYEIGEDHGELFIAMELLEGEPLSERLRHGPLSVSQASPIALGILAALSALHARGIVHRDLKPSNVFLTPHGVKLLDFGLARPRPEPSFNSATGITNTGTVVGTPNYMAPEQVTATEVDGRCDLYALGAILFEMLAGRPAFGGRNMVDILHATMYEQPPALQGTPAVAAVDRVIRRALAKRPVDRPASADAMADELRAIHGGDDSTATLARPLTRLVVLPFRQLRPDPETDFLTFSLPDAIATSLSGTGSLIVRSSSTAARFAAETPDLKALAAEADVDRVVIGTLLRSGDQLRAVAQLVEAPGGTILTSQTVQSSLGDLFRLQDDLARRIVEALSLPLTGAAATSTPDAPHNARAYELYLRGNELARTMDGMVRARDFYRQCLELDPRFAPAWARLGRCQRLIGKFVENSPDSRQRAQESFDRALELNPRLSVAHKYYANLESEIGRASHAVVRLLSAAQRHGNDPELFAGLVHACRYCGLFEESLAAHAEARRLDPNVSTSFGHTLLLNGDVERLLAVEPPPLGASREEWLLGRVIGLGVAGLRDASREALTEMRRSPRVSAFQAFGDYLKAWLDGRPADMLAGLAALGHLEIQEDPEAVFFQGWTLCDAGEHEEGLRRLQRAVSMGYFVARTLATSSAFDPLRSDPRFQATLAEAEEGQTQALDAFRQAGGERLFGR